MADKQSKESTQPPKNETDHERGERLFKKGVGPFMQKFPADFPIKNFPPVVQREFIIAHEMIREDQRALNDKKREGKIGDAEFEKQNDKISKRRDILVDGIHTADEKNKSTFKRVYDAGSRVLSIDPVEKAGKVVGEIIRAQNNKPSDFKEKINKIDNSENEKLLKEGKKLTISERNEIMRSVPYKDKLSPLFKLSQDKVAESFKYQYPGTSKGPRSGNSVTKENTIPTAPQPLTDSFGKSINDSLGSSLSRSVDMIGEDKAVRTFQESMNKLPTDISSTVPTIEPKPLKVDGDFGPKTKTRMQEHGLRHGVDAVRSIFNSNLSRKF